jgi:two-component system, probable response regulator PhcQ
MPRILLVDDEPNVLKSLRRTIMAMPETTFEDEPIIETFDKPELALARAAKCDFDLVISDWRMPSMNGIAFLQRLVSIQPDIARLILSAYGDFLADIKDIVRIKIFHFINKPWSSDELSSLMSQALEHRRTLLSHGTLRRLGHGDETLVSEGELLRIAQQAPTFPWTTKVLVPNDKTMLS